MRIWDIKNPAVTAGPRSWDLDPAVLAELPEVENFEARVVELRRNADKLRQLRATDILSFFDEVVRRWLKNDETFLSTFGPLGISFLLSFMRRSNLEPLLRESLRGNTRHLDEFVPCSLLGNSLMCHPRGLITHWLAGNVPILGMISLIQGLLSKNANLVKVPRQNGLVLPALVHELAKHNVDTKGGQQIRGKDIAAAVMFVYCTKDDADAQHALSDSSDVRVAWGGKEAVESVMSIPKLYGTEDVIFGPKYSFAVIGRDMDRSQLDDLAYRLALDASVFDQHGCNSPHTVFIETGGAIGIQEYARALAQGMEKANSRIPKSPVTADEAYAIMSVRAEYGMLGEVYKSSGTEWTVVCSDEEGFAVPSFSRVVFVRPVADIFDILPYISRRNQTLGLMVDGERRSAFAKAATARGIERVTNLGNMSLYTYPWDGMFPMDRFVRWVSLENVRPAA